MISKFRKKPVVIEAVQWTGSNIDEVVKIYMDGTDESRVLKTHCPEFGKVAISTFEGDMIADIDDWIIKGVKGEVYPCKPDIFVETYEEVN